MDWITPTNLKADFAPVKDLTTTQAQAAIDAAEDELVELVGQAAIDDTLENSPTNTARATRLVRAHKFLSVAIGVWNVDNVKRQQDESSPGNERVITNEVWNPKDIQMISDTYRGMALKAAGSYLIVDAVGDEYEAGVAYSHPEITSCPDVCSKEYIC